MTCRPRVSVLMAVHNAQPFLRQAIDSILEQTLTDLELIVVDDGSSDDGWDVIAEVAARDPRVVPIRRTKQGGASAALNEGLAVAKGELVTRQDSDDVSLPARLAEQVAFLDSRGDVGLVGTAVTLVDAQGQALSRREFPTANEDLQRRLQEQMCFCGPTVMVRRHVLDSIEFRFDEALSGSEDYDMCLRAAEVTRIANLPEPLYLYRQHPSSVSRSREHEQLARKALAMEHALGRRFGSTPPTDLLTAVARDFATAAVMAHFRGGSPDTVAAWLARAARLASPILDGEGWLAGVVGHCTSSLPTSVALARTAALFNDVLPQGQVLRRLRRRLTAELHLREVFRPVESVDPSAMRRHLWCAVRENPAWLANRGILARLVRGFVTRNPVASLT